MIMLKWTCISKTPVTCNMIILKFSAFKNMWTCNVFCKALVKFNKAFIIKLFNKFFIIKLLQSFIKLLSSFYEAFIKHLRSFAKLIKPFQILFPVLTSTSHENTIEIPLTSKKRRQAKLCLVDAWSQSVFFTGETIFLVGFS